MRNFEQLLPQQLEAGIRVLIYAGDQVCMQLAE